jgi:hypothetical protein
LAAEPESSIVEKYLKAENDESYNAEPWRLILAPDFDTIGGVDGFIRLLPHIIELKPALVILNAEDVYDSRARKDLITSLKSGRFMVLYDRLLEGKIDPAVGTHGRVDEVDGTLRLGFIRLPDTADIKMYTLGTSPQICSSDHINVPFTSTPGTQSPLGRALLAAGYKIKTRKDRSNCLSAMPADFKRKEMLVIDVIGTKSDSSGK